MDNIYCVTRSSPCGIIGSAIVKERFPKAKTIFTSPRNLARVFEEDISHNGQIIIHDMPFYEYRIPKVQAALAPFANRLNVYSHFYLPRDPLPDDMDRKIFFRKHFNTSVSSAELLYAAATNSMLSPLLPAIASYTEGFVNTRAMMESNLQRDKILKIQAQHFDFAIAAAHDNVGFKRSLIDHLANGGDIMSAPDLLGFALQGAVEFGEYTAQVQIHQGKHYNQIDGNGIPAGFRSRAIRKIHNPAQKPVSLMEFKMHDHSCYLLYSVHPQIDAGILSSQAAADANGYGGGTPHMGGGCIEEADAAKFRKRLNDRIPQMINESKQATTSTNPFNAPFSSLLAGGR